MPLSRLLEAANISSRSIFLTSALVSIWCLSVCWAVNDLLRTRWLCSYHCQTLLQVNSGFSVLGTWTPVCVFGGRHGLPPNHEYFIAGWPSLLRLTLGWSVGFLWPRNVGSHDSPTPGKLLNMHVWSSLVSSAPVPHQENNGPQALRTSARVLGKQAKQLS